MMYDFYRSKVEPDERMATVLGAGLPGHVNPDDWKLMTGLTECIPELHVDIEEDIAERGIPGFQARVA